MNEEKITQERRNEFDEFIIHLKHEDFTKNAESFHVDFKLVEKPNNINTFEFVNLDEAISGTNFHIKHEYRAEHEKKIKASADKFKIRKNDKVFISCRKF